MKKKENVYVVVDTPKKAKKVKKVFDMFGENIYEPTNERLINCILSNEYPVINFNDYWLGACESIKDNKTEVSIKELRNILAVEHLKEGDVVVTKVGNEKIIAVYDKFGKNVLFQAKRWVRVSDGFKWNQEGCFNTFLRYATEEEKALLSEDLTIADYKLGVWYKSNNGSLIYFNDTEYTYGFFADGEFYDKIEWLSEFRANGFHEPGNWVEAKDKEVITAIEKEAEKRFGTDWLNVKIKDHVEGLTKWTNLNEGTFATDQHFTDRLYNKNGRIYYNGKWAEILEEPKSIEVGKWYKHDNGEFPNWIVFYDEKSIYGFASSGTWFETNGYDYEDMFDYITEQSVLEEATKEEVEQALINEAKKRGYADGVKVRCLGHKIECTIAKSENEIIYHSEWNKLWFGEMSDRASFAVVVFQDGKWAEIVEPSFVEQSDKIKVAGENIGKRVRVLDGGSGATGCNGQTGVIVEKPKKCLNGSLSPVIYVKLDNGHTWGLAMDHKIEYLTESSPLTVSLEIKDIATLQVIQKTLKELEEKLTKLI